MPAARPRDAKQPQPRARMPSKPGRLGEQQQRGVRHPPVACSVLDQPVVPKRLQNRPPADGSSCQKPLRQLQIEVVQRRVAAQALLEADPTVGLLALIDDFLRFPRHVVADPIRKAVAGHHDGFRSDWDVEHQHFDAGYPQPVGTARDGRSQPSPGNRHEVIVDLIRVVVTRRRPVVLDSYEKHPPVSVRKCRDGLGDSVSYRSTFDLRRDVAAPVPGRLELQKLTLVPGNEISKLGFGEQRRAHPTCPRGASHALSRSRSRATPSMAFV